MFTDDEEFCDQVKLVTLLNQTKIIVRSTQSQRMLYGQMVSLWEKRV